ncbi:MAG TPA: peptidylprolyl isomerase [Pyrinomonadaceae bacterium]|nr:peptidylprolyl isomerase [Pyrinomonadaceae bacterium]
MKRKLQFLPGLLAFFAVFCAISQAQNARRQSLHGIPTATLLTIVRHEDERRWDDQLQTLLTDKDAQVRARVALAAGRIGDERAVPALADMALSGSESAPKEMAVFALGEIEAPGGAYALLTILKNPQNPARARAIEALGKITAAMMTPPVATTAGGKGPNDERLDSCKAGIVDALRYELERKPGRDRLTVLLGLTAILRVRPDGAGPLAVKFLDDPDPAIVATALNTMARLRLKDANERVRQLLTNSDPMVRANAVRVIGAAEHKEAFDAVLDRALHDTDLRVRVSAIRTLASLKDRRAVEPLLTAAGSPPAADRIGVPECDSFIAEYNSCVSSKVPESARQQFNTAVEQWRQSWKKLAGNPGSRAALAQACTQAAAQQKAALRSYGCFTTGINEQLEIATALGRLLPNSADEAATAWLRALHDQTKGESAEVEVAMARVAPSLFLGDGLKTQAGSPTITWRQISRRAQGLAAIRDVVEAAAGSAGEQTLKASQKELAGMLEQPNLPTLAISDVLEAYAGYKPADLDQYALRFLQSNDVVVRGNAAQILGNQKPSDENARALINALPRALRDRVSNDAALAVLGALAKQKTAAANDAIKTALESKDQLIRRRAVALLKTNGAGDFSDRIGTVQTRNTLLDYRRALGRLGKHPTATVVTSRGSFTIEFLPDEAPLTVDNFLQLAKRGYFNGQTIPRVVPNFVIQTGDPRGDQNGGPGYQIRCEINEVPYERAAVGMALSGKDTGGSQWFVTHSPQPHLDGGYTVFGRVIRGMEVVDNIARGDAIRRIVVSER